MLYIERVLHYSFYTFLVTKCGPVCEIYCLHGNVLDANGCPTCSCNIKPTKPMSCSDLKCSPNEICIEDDSHCESGPCDRNPRCKGTSKSLKWFLF